MHKFKSMFRERIRSGAARLFSVVPDWSEHASRHAGSIQRVASDVRSVLQTVGRVEGLLSELVRQHGRLNRYPVTVSVLGVTLLDDSAEGRAWSPMDEPGLEPGRTTFGGEPVPVVATSATPKLTSIVGARTVWLSSAEEGEAEFSFDGRMIRRGAMVWVTGPGLLTSVRKGHELCQAFRGAGPVFLVPSAIQVGQLLSCTVVGLPNEPIQGGM